MGGRWDKKRKYLFTTEDTEDTEKFKVN